MKNSKITLIVLLWAGLGTACQEDGVVPVMPSITEALHGSMWELERWSLRYADGSITEVPLESCDIDTWEFFDSENVFVIYAQWQALYTSEEEKCGEESYRIVQSYQREGNTLTLTGPDQGFRTTWGDHEVSDLEVTLLSSEKLSITYRIKALTEDSTAEEQADVQVTHNFFRSQG